MKNYLILTIIFLSLLSCKKDVDLGDRKMVYMPQSIKGLNPYYISLNKGQMRLIFGAAVGGTEALDQTAQVSFKIDSDLVSAYNKKNYTEYKMLPATAFTIPNDKITIEKGKVNSAALDLLIKSSDDIKLGEEYLLPISIDEVSNDFVINQELRTSYFHFQVVRDLISRDSWKIIDSSSEEPGENNWGNSGGGLGKHAIDNLNTTYWHTKWDGGQPAPPHYLVIDFNENNLVHGFLFLNRNNRILNGGNPKNISLLSSLDNKTWKMEKQLVLENTDEEQQIIFAEAITLRYVKIIVETTFDDGINHRPNPSTHIAEINAF